MTTRRDIPVAEAITLYEQLRSWTKVAAVLRRPGGQRFWPDSIKMAVKRELARREARESAS
jgi:hypothetical protein